MWRPDILIVVEYHMNDDEGKTHIRTNAKREALDELMDNWLQDRMFMTRQEDRESGEKDGEPVERDFYTIKIGYGVEPEAFAHESDTGDRRTTLGIIRVVLEKLGELEVRPL